MQEHLLQHRVVRVAEADEDAREHPVLARGLRLRLGHDVEHLVRHTPEDGAERAHRGGLHVLAVGAQQRPEDAPDLRPEPEL